MGKKVTVNEAIQSLKEGKTILYPTDTIWGLGCSIHYDNAIQKIKTIKKRSPQKSFILLVDSVAMLERYVPHFPNFCYDLIDYATSPLTIIYEHPEDIPDSLTAADGSIGIRVTKDKNCQRIIQGIRSPLVSTSANISGEPSPTCFADIQEEIKDEVDLILNLRMDEVNTTPSKIIKVNNNGVIKLIR